MKLIKIEANENWLYNYSLAEWAERSFKSGEWLLISNDCIAVFDKNIAKYGLAKDQMLDFTIFENSGEFTRATRR